MCSAYYEVADLISTTTLATINPMYATMSAIPQLLGRKYPFQGTNSNVSTNKPNRPAPVSRSVVLKCNGYASPPFCLII